ncbi:MAG: aminopeptidase [Ruminococcaceae bacterium]|nr:aminopeptidase [Oscillospiraceae bacterium]
MERKDAEKLQYKQKSSIPESVAEQVKVDEFIKGYRHFIDNAKTERTATRYAEGEAIAAGFKPYTFGDKLKAGDRICYVNHEKSLILAVIGEKPLDEGARIVASHIDSPRLDLKPRPLYENSDIAYFKTHYYGGIKKYQWTTVPLELHGVVYRQDGTRIDINIGADPQDPVFYISDLMPHIGKDQMSKVASEVITGEGLNIISGSMPIDADGGVKLKVLSILNEKYGITERDLITAELTAVPAIMSREVGFDRSLIAAYGHDDRICAYPSFNALFNLEIPQHTAVVILADKEEIGSYGITGLGSETYPDFIKSLCDSTGADYLACKRNSVCLSADVGGAYDPCFADAYEANNSCYINRGVVISKYTGSRGKSGSSDASAETLAKLCTMFDAENVAWQVGEYGKVDQGGAGTVSSEIAHFGIEVIDCGVPILSMHSITELASKYDIYEMFRACAAFFKS